MGQRFQFTCESCGYSADVSGGGDAGGTVCTQTYQCLDCRKLFDAVILEMLPQDRSKAIPPRFPKRKNHRIIEWQAGGLCPKCNGPMRAGELMCLWD